jgi:hypothetical protein
MTIYRLKNCYFYCLLALLSIASRAFSMEMPSSFEQKTPEKTVAELFCQIPHDILRIIFDLSSLSGKKLFFNELARQVELVDVHYDTIVQAYIPTLEYYASQDDIPALLERNFKTTTLDKTKFQSKIAKALQKYLGSHQFDRISRHIKNKDAGFIKKCANLYLHKLEKLRAMLPDQLNQHLAALDLDEQNKIHDMLAVTIKLMKSCQKLILSNKNYAQLNKLYHNADFLFPYLCNVWMATCSPVVPMKIVSYFIGGEELFSYSMACIKPFFTLSLFSMVAAAGTMQQCDERALLKLNEWLEAELKGLEELQRKIQRVS